MAGKVYLQGKSARKFLLPERMIAAGIIIFFSVIVHAAPRVQVEYSNKGITIAGGEQAKAIIVQGKDAITPEKTAAKELSEYLSRTTGVEFEVIMEGEESQKSNIIYVGQTQYAMENGINFALLGPEQWFIRTVNGNLILAGGRPRGVLYSVYRFLEDVVGIRWWSPWEEFVPKHTELATGELNLHGEPVFEKRCLNTTNFYSFRPPLSGAKLWSVRSRINRELHERTPYSHGGGMEYGPPYFVHTEGRFLRLFKEKGYLDKHPEWVAMREGERALPDGSIHQQLCLSNNDMRSAYLEKLRGKIENTRNWPIPPKFFDVSLNDVSHICSCEKCSGIVSRHGGKDSGLLLDFVNFLADGVKEEYPDVLIRTLAYLNTEEAPEGIKPRENVIITLVDTGSTYTAPISKDGYFAKRLEEWGNISDKIFIWDYHTNFADPALPMPFESTFQPDLQLFRKNNVVGVMTEFHSPIWEDMRDLRLWLLAKLFEDPYRDQNELIMTFTEGFYGPAGIFIREYLRTLQNAARENPSIMYVHGQAASLKYLTPEFVINVQEIFDRAEESVRDSEILSRRVRHARIAIDKATLAIFPRIWQYWAEKDENTDKKVFAREQIFERLEDTVEQQWELRAGETPGQHITGRKNRFFDNVNRHLARKLIIIEPPAKFEDLPEYYYTDYPADTFVLYGIYTGQRKIVEGDEGSETGIVHRTELSEADLRRIEEYVLRWDLHDYTTRATGVEPTISYLRPEDIEGPGYNWYKLSTYQLTEDNFLWIYDSDLEVNLRNAYNPIDTDAEYDVWARVKFEGPVFPHGKIGLSNAVYIERITLVKSSVIE